MSEKWERWNKEELHILKTCYPNMPRDDLTRLLPGRGWRSICRAAEKRELHRKHYGTQRSEQFLKELHNKLSIARKNRKPFAGCHHTKESKLAISVSNLYARFNCVADISALKGITEKEVRGIIEKQKK